MTAIVILILPLILHEPCIGDSESLDPRECDLWQLFYTALDGPNWTEIPKIEKTNPCEAIRYLQCSHGSLTEMSARKKTNKKKNIFCG